MRKLDELMLRSFIGPFILTTAVATFILLIQYLLKYFDDLVGKNLGFSVFGELLFYFSLNMMQNSLPLGVLVASIMTFGNLGESFELTAIKSAGISLPRILRPIFFFVILISIGTYFFNNYTIPAVNLKAYSLLYDIKHTKPALDIKEGAFYNGIPDYSIKVKEKFPDGKTLKDIIIYDHSNGRGNKTVILADSSLMYTILDERYLKLELFNGHYYSEKEEKDKEIDQFVRTEFQKMDIVFNLSSFDFKERKEELFQNNRQMKNIDELTHDIDSFKMEMLQQKVGVIRNVERYFDYHFKKKELIKSKLETVEDTTERVRVKIDKASMIPFLSAFQEQEKSEEEMEQELIEREKLDNVRLKKEALMDLQSLNDSSDVQLVTKKKGIVAMNGTVDSLEWNHLDSAMKYKRVAEKTAVSTALNKARNIKVNMASTKTRVYKLQKDANLFTIEREKKYAMALACIIMFMIGAPLGAIIKKGGLGVPVIIAIFFFILYYVIGMIGNQQAKENQMSPFAAAWMSDVILLPFGLYFLRQARIDARLFDTDAYNVFIEKLKTRFARNTK